MTSRERLVAASRGGEVDQQPVIHWPLVDGASSDLQVFDFDRFQPSTELVTVVEVLNPFGRALREGIDLNALLREEPETSKLDELVEATRDEFRRALELGADGVLYLLQGANAEHCSPMQYGGHYLERDRELLAEVQDAVLNVLFVPGTTPYLDFVSDLPAQIFAWDSVASAIPVSEVRPMRDGALASADPSSDVLFLTDVEQVAHHLEKTRTHV